MVWVSQSVSVVYSVWSLCTIDTFIVCIARAKSMYCALCRAYNYQILELCSSWSVDALSLSFFPIVTMIMIVSMVFVSIWPIGRLNWCIWACYEFDLSSGQDHQSNERIAQVLALTQSHANLLMKIFFNYCFSCTNAHRIFCSLSCNLNFARTSLVIPLPQP